MYTKISNKNIQTNLFWGCLGLFSITHFKFQGFPNNAKMFVFFSFLCEIYLHLCAFSLT